jgi:hypothetical protein
MIAGAWLDDREFVALLLHSDPPIQAAADFSFFNVRGPILIQISSSVSRLVQHCHRLANR